MNSGSGGLPIIAETLHESNFASFENSELKSWKSLALGWSFVSAEDVLDCIVTAYCLCCCAVLFQNPQTTSTLNVISLPACEMQFYLLSVSGKTHSSCSSGLTGFITVILPVVQCQINCSRLVHISSKFSTEK